MSLKIEVNNSAVAYHINQGATVFPYAVDAQHAVSNFPMEWSTTPWRREDAEAAHKRLAEKYAADVEDAKARGAPAPEPLPPAPAPLSAEDQAALDEHNKAVAEAAARLDAYYAKKAEEDKVAAQIAADEAMVASLPPAPDLSRPRRPFGRTGEPTPAELEQIKKREAKKAADDKLAKDKADADKLAGNTPAITG